MSGSLRATLALNASDTQEWSAEWGSSGQVYLTTFFHGLLEC